MEDRETRQPARPTPLSAACSGWCREALQRLEEAQGLPPMEFIHKVDQAERAVVCFRNDLIDEIRRQPVMPATATLRQMLDRVNGALSLVIGMEYPSAGIHRELMERATRTLREMGG